MKAVISSITLILLSFTNLTQGEIEVTVLDSFVPLILRINVGENYI